MWQVIAIDPAKRKAEDAAFKKETMVKALSQLQLDSKLKFFPLNDTVRPYFE